jgi:hypothetical protein
MAEPVLGDVILRRIVDGSFEVVDAVTERHIAGPVQLSRAVQLAKAHGARSIWQQNVDERGRPVGPLSRIPLM